MIHTCKVKKSTFSAFTLAEVLITLAIVGVLAILLLHLIENTQKQQYTSALKKAYTTFNQAILEVETDYNCVGDLSCTGLFTSQTDGFASGDAFAKHFNISKNCSNTDNADCMSSDVNTYIDGSSSTVWNMNSTYDYINSKWHYRFITTDGVSYDIINTNDNCTGTNYSGYVYNCGKLDIDINGPNKGPNYAGRDVFFYYITPNKGLYPRGLINWGGGYWKNVGCGGASNPQGGEACSGRILQEDWQMKY